MTTLLAIESSSELASVAIMIGDQILSHDLSGVQTHSQGLLPAIQRLLMDAGVSLQQCDGIAFGCGPGAFTGVRTTCGVVQGLAFGADVPVMPVVSLQAMAERARGLASNNSQQFVSVLDARMGEVYWAAYRYLNGAWSNVTAPVLSRFDAVFTENWPQQTVFAFGHGLALPKARRDFVALTCMPHAEQVARLGLIEFLAGRGVDASHAQPLYLRNKIALTTIERLQAKAMS